MICCSIVACSGTGNAQPPTISGTPVQITSASIFANSIDLWIRALADSDLFAAGQAANSLGRMGPAALPALTGALTHRDPGVRYCASIALYKMGPTAEPAVSALVAALNDSSELVRWGAVMALRNTGARGSRVVPGLLRCLSDRDQDVRMAASRTLLEIAPQATVAGWPQVAALLDSLVPRLMTELHVPGVSIAMIQNRNVCWSNVYGLADQTGGVRVDSATLFEACSMSKPVFAYLVMKLVDEGKISLDVPLSQYLREPLADADLQPITARMALSHTSGLSNWRKGEEERGGPLTVKFSPGSRFSYSGEGIFYLQRVVEAITGEPLDRLAARMLFGPMGLKSCSYVWTQALNAHIASGHDETGKFRLKTSYTHPNAAYTLYVSARDFAELMLLMVRPEGRSLEITRASLDTMLTHQVQLDSRDPIERPGEAMGLTAYWGLGWSINATAAGDIAHHGGSNRSGFRCFSQFNRHKGSGIVIMTNGANGTDLWTRVISRIGDL
jgi:CubicO group peptidase (beta-lactamase class C family)